jgi:glycosyltransferase involved in cell wall biosynthesis
MVHKKGHTFLEKVTVGSANAVTVYGEFLSQRFRERYPLLSERIDVLPNGFDPADIESIVKKERRNGFYRIVYMGSLYPHHKTNFLVLIDAVKNLPEKIRNIIEIIFVGQFYEDAVEQLRSANLEEIIKFIGYVPHSEALSYLASADAGLLFIRPNDFSSVTGKVFEYLMVRRPIIACIEPKGLCAEVLRKAGQSDWIIPPDDAESLTNTIVALFEAGWPQPKGSGYEQFSRKRNTELLASILDRILGNNSKQVSE